MFDLATRPLPAGSAAARPGVLFDLRLTVPGEPQSYPFTDFGAVPAAAGAELLATYALQLEDTLQTAVILSLFTDARAGRDDVLPLGQTDLRGWVGDEYTGAAATDVWGSRLWLIYVGKASGNVLDLARLYVQQALAWLVREGIASRVDVSAQWVGERQDRLAVRPVIYQPGEVAPVYDVLWGTSYRRAAEGGAA